MEQTYTSLEEDQERFNKIQMTDQNNFQDKLDSLQVGIKLVFTLSINAHNLSAMSTEEKQTLGYLKF